MRRILVEIQAPLLSDTAFHAFNKLNNPYSRRDYERISSEFRVSPHTDWQLKQSKNDGLGLICVYVTSIGYQLYYLGEPGHYNLRWMSFTDYNSLGKSHIDNIAQGVESGTAWMSFIPDESHGFTQAGVER